MDTSNSGFKGLCAVVFAIYFSIPTKVLHNFIRFATCLPLLCLVFVVIGLLFVALKEVWASPQRR